MWRTTSLVVTLVLASSLAAAQAPPVPPAPPALQRTAPLPVPPVPPAPPAPPAVPDFSLGLRGLEGLRNLEGPAVALEATVASLEAIGRSFDEIGFPDVQDVVAAKAQGFAYASEGMDYDRGTSYIDSGRYDRAVEAFDRVIAKGGKKADGAMYWKAYALGRLGKRDESIKTIEELLKKFPSSRWTNDAKALLIDVRQASGQAVSPDAAGDEELKLIALNGLMARDPDRAIPMIEQMLGGSASPKLKERGLFVLAQSASPRARTLLGDVAKGKGNPDLQLKALDYLGAFSAGPDVPLLVEVYKSTGDIDVKKRVIRSLAMTGRRGFAVFNYTAEIAPVVAGQAMDEARAALDRAKADLDRSRAQAENERARADIDRARADIERQRTAVARRSGEAFAWSSATSRSASSEEREKARQAKAKEAGDALWQLYQGETSLELKREILRNMRFASQGDRLLQVAKTDANPELRQAAVQGLLVDRTPQSTDVFLGLYRNEKDAAVRRQIIDGLASPHGSAAALVQAARQESDPTLRKRIVERLSTMKDKEAVDYMMEILKK